ncbi:hypothetical protein KAW43_01680 [Candidatus Parcubacteria bacterium]|nr:hypothetical protein [Candidatus Parcubacteria bacterium]
MKKFQIVILIFCLSFFGFLAFQNSRVNADASDNVFGWAWSENIGWISFNCNNSELPEPRCNIDYGVDIDEATGDFSGYAWSENVGWISFEASDLSGCEYPDSTHGCSAWVDMLNGEVSGWAKVLCSDSWIRLRDTDYGVDIDIDTGEFHKWAWSDDYGWISFNCFEGGPDGENICGASDYKVVTTVPFLSMPYIEDLTFSPNYCTEVAGKGHISLEWKYKNDSGNAQAKFNLQVAANPAKNPDGTFVDPLVNFEDVVRVVSPDGECTSCIVVVLSPSGPQDIFYNDHYYWQVQVEDVLGLASVWKGGPEFDTPLHPYPYPDFTLLPESPSVGEEIQLCSTLGVDCVEDVSVCYNAAGGAISCTGNAFEWTIPDASFIDSDDSSENPKIQFDALGDGKVIKLGITDSIGFCAREKLFDISLPLPNWKEVIPF